MHKCWKIAFLFCCRVVYGSTAHKTVYGKCTSWDVCEPVDKVDMYWSPYTQTLCKASVAVEIEQVDWKSNGTGFISNIQLNNHSLLSSTLYPAQYVHPDVYPQCQSWIDAFNPLSTIEPGTGSKRSIIDIAKEDSIATSIEIGWKGKHDHRVVCSMNGVSYAVVIRLDYEFEAQDLSNCPRWNATTTSRCSGNGECLCANADGLPRACACKQGYGGVDCADCDTGHYGEECANVCPVCANGGVCSSGMKGDGKCLCKEGFDAATQCSTCLPGRFGPNCNACPNCNFPAGNCVDGIAGNGQCACATGWDMNVNCSDCMDNFYGDHCEPCAPCGNGKCNSGKYGNGSCKCNFGFAESARCTECSDGFFGEDCLRCQTCHERGICNDLVNGDGTCTCEVGYSSLSRCLRCDVGWDFNPSTMRCQCAPEHWGEHCLSCPICAPHGRCNAGRDGDGSCICDIGWSNSNNCVGCMNSYFGSKCERCKHCGHGKCNDGFSGDGSCICHRGWDSSQNCYDCLDGFFGTNCTECPQDCGNGQCSSQLNGTGLCLCDAGWDEESEPPCTTCLPGYIGRNCTACPGLVHSEIACGGHGVCSEVNTVAVCTCDARYFGPGCSDYRFPLVMVTILGFIALATLGICMCTMRNLARGPRPNGGTGVFNKADYVEIAGVSDLELFVSADSKDWVIPFESLTLQYEVGNGTSGQVFRSVYHSGGGSSTVAVKRLYSPVTGQEYFQNFFRREVSILSKLHHPNVVRFYGVSYYSRILYIVTDFCPASLCELIEDHSATGTFEPSFFIKIVTQLTSGMGFLHSRNVVHRDLKPANVLLNDTDDVNICDFGLSRLIDPDATSMTAEVGTPSYMAPEMATMGGIQCSTKGDVYSFGILLYSMWTRSKPYGDQGMNPFQLMTAVVNGLRPVIPINCPPGLASLMRSCWDANPDIRPSFPEISLQIKDDSILQMPNVTEHLSGTKPRRKARRDMDVNTTYGSSSNLIVSPRLSPTADTHVTSRRDDAMPS